MLDTRVTVSIYKIEEYGSGGYQILNKVSEFFYPLGKHRLFLDNTNTTTDNNIIYLNYNSNNTQILLKRKENKTLYNFVSDPYAYDSSYGYKLLPNDIFNEIIIKDKRQIQEGFSEGCVFRNMIYYILLFGFLYYLYTKTQTTPLQ
jgi:hypothetical protein